MAGKKVKIITSELSLIFEEDGKYKKKPGKNTLSDERNDNRIRRM